MSSIGRTHEPGPGEAPGSWSFLTNHACILVALHRDPDLRQREIAYQVGITEGAVQRILNELEEAGYLSVERVGRRNHYDVDVAAPMRQPLDPDCRIGDLLRNLDSLIPPAHRSKRTAA